MKIEFKTDQFADLGLTTALSTMAGALSRDMGPGLEERAGRLLDRHLDGRDLREIAVQWLMDQARDRARGRTAGTEKAATRFSLPVQVTIPGHVGEGEPGSWKADNICRTCAICKGIDQDKADRQKQKDVEAVKEEASRQRPHPMVEAFRLFSEYEDDLKTRLRMEWTAELLSAEIAMPDGTRTTWGDATMAQHQTRHDMLARNAMTNIDNAVRHSLAIDLLAQTGAANLNGALEETEK